MVPSCIIFLLFLLTLCDAIPVDEGRSVEIVPFVTAGPIASLQDPTGAAFIFYQKTDGSIWQWSTTGPFETGISNASQNVQVVPAGQAVVGTPIASTAIYETFKDHGASFRIFFLSTTNVVSEYIWNNDVGWQGGTTCTQCLTQKGFTAPAGSKILYALQLQGGSGLRVGFVSNGVPGTLCEADSTGIGDWVIAEMPLAQ